LPLNWRYRFADFKLFGMKREILAFVGAVFISALCNAQSDKDIFINPMDISPALSASFSELRADHFHSGIDFKTGGAIGKEVNAAAGGYIYRISVSPTGFGNAIYIRHPNGYSTVYGHLDHFRKDIADYVITQQYENKNFTITLYPSKDIFPVSQGDLIAWSGDSGGSAGPHLHFEIRESSTENPVNPLLFNIVVADNMKPGIEKIVIYPVTNNSSVNNSHSSLSVKTAGTGGNYTLAAPAPLVVNGIIGFGIKTTDTFNESVNKCGVYRIYAEVDSVGIYDFTCDEFSFSESRYINSHIDYGRRIENKEFLHKTWLEPGNKLSMYSGIKNRGLISFTDNKTHRILIRVSDIKGNTSVVRFSVRSVATPPVKAAQVKCSEIIPYGKAAEFSSDGIRVHFPVTSFYDTLFFTYKYKARPANLLSGIHSVHKESTPIHDMIRISIKPDSIPEGLEKKMFLVKLSNSHTQTYAGGEMRFGYISAEVRSFGDYAVSIDTTGPEIKPSFVRGSNLTGRKAITVTITDNLSGISSYDGYIDDNWALFEYDAKKNMLTYHTDAGRIKPGTAHKLEMRVTDNRGNTTNLKSSFTW